MNIELLDIVIRRPNGLRLDISGADIAGMVKETSLKMLQDMLKSNLAEKSLVDSQLNSLEQNPALREEMIKKFYSELNLNILKRMQSIKR